jgi:hypothetical protein
MIYAVDQRINLVNIVTMETLVPRITMKDSVLSLIVNEVVLADISYWNGFMNSSTVRPGTFLVEIVSELRRNR